MWPRSLSSRPRILSPASPNTSPNSASSCPSTTIRTTRRSPARQSPPPKPSVRVVIPALAPLAPAQNSDGCPAPSVFPSSPKPTPPTPFVIPTGATRLFPARDFQRAGSRSGGIEATNAECLWAGIARERLSFFWVCSGQPSGWFLSFPNFEFLFSLFSSLRLQPHPLQQRRVSRISPH